MRAVSFLKIATFLLVLIAFVYPVSAVWYNHSWINRMELVLDDSQISGTHSNFSMYVGVTSLDLNVSQSDGDDIIFVLDDGTKLSHEIDNFNSSTGVLHAYVKVPELNLSTKLYLYYNNPAINNSENASDVWLDYAAVWHLSQSPSAPGTYNVLDSTSNNNNCTADSVAMNSTNLVDGKFYKALNFSAVNNQSISALDSVSLSPTGTALTMVVWVKTPATLQNAYNVITTKSFNEGQASPYSAYSLYMANNALSNRFHAGAANATSWAQNIHSFAIATPAPPTTSTWYQVAFVKNATNHIGYVDGTIRTTINNTFNLVDTAWEFRIGGNPIGQEPFSGIVDEVTIRASTITPERMQTEYNNQNYPDTFITLGSEQTNTSNIAPTIISARLTPTIAYYNDTISGYCNATDENGDTLSYDYKWCGNGCATLNYTANISNFTIQEQFNSSDCINTSFENYCDGNYSTGVLSNDSGSVSAEYIKSGQLRGAIWEITYGLNVNNPQKINYTVDPTCISNNDTISLSTAIAYFSPYYNVFSCYNGTEYIELGSYTLTNGYLYEERLFLDYGLGFSSSNENLISTRTTDIDGSQFQYTDDIYLVCRANDGYLVSDWATSSILNISNTNITANSMISPSTAYKNDTLVGYCNATNDDSSLYYVNWTWYLNGVVNSTGQDFCDYMYCEYSQTAIVDTNISIMTKGQNWTLECFVDNYVGETDYSNSSIVISNSIPTVPSLSVNASLFVGEALVASASGSSDVDNDSLSYFYEFYNINDTSTVQAYSTTASYTVAVSDAHNIIRVRSKVYDGSVYSGVNESNTTINNSVPSFNESNFVSTISHGVNVSLQINASDTDADTLTYAINDTRFTINSSSGLINKTNSLSTVGEYNVTINVTDGTATISMSVFFNITNTAPTTPATLFANNTLTVGQLLTAEVREIYLNDSLLVFYDFEKTNTTPATIPDRSTYNNDGIIYIYTLTPSPGMLTVNTSYGKFGSGVNFNGSPNVSTGFIAYNNTYNLSGNFTVMLWANFHPITLDSAIFFGPSAACASPRQWSFTQAKSGYLYFQYSTNGTNYLAIELGNYTQLNVYTHYAFVKNSSGVATYINGVYQGFVAFGSGYVGPLTYSPSPIFVGKGGCGYTDPNTQFSNSSMDNVALYNRTLTATEVAEGVNISGSTDGDGDVLTYYYEFYNINDTTTVQAYSTIGTYTIQVIDAHDIIRIRSKAFDGLTYSSEIESNATISNIMPTFNESNFVSIISHGVNISLQINASDTDADTLTYAINDTRFTINSSSGLINKTNSLSTVGEYNVTINVTDGTATISMSVFFNITNTAPNTSAAYISILPSPATIYDNLTCNVTSYSDIDNDTLTFYYNWTLDGIILGVHTGLLDSNNLTANNTNVTCSAIIDDGIINSTWITSPLVVFDDLTMPAMTYYLQSSSGYTDTSYYVYINCSDDYSGIASGYPKTSFIDPDNILAGNFSLSLINNTLYGLLYTFTKAGVYNNFSFYCADAQNNINSSVNTNLTFTSTTRPSNGTTPPTSGGGASEETTLKYGVISILQLLQRAKIIYKNNSYITNIKGLDDKHKEVTMNIGKKEYIFVENIITPLDLNSDGVPDATIKITDILPSVAKFILNYYNATTGRCDDNIFIDGFGEHTECEFACTLDGCQVLDVGQRASSARECSSRLLESGRCIATSPIKYILSEDYFGLQGVLSNTLNQITTIRDVKGIPVGKDITVTNVDNQEIFIKFFGEDLQDIAEEKLSAGVSHLFQLKIYPVRGKTKGFIDMVVAKNNFTVTHSILYEMSIVTCKDAGTKVSYAQECCSKVVDDNGVCMNSKSTKNNIYIYIGIVLLVAALTVIIFYLIRTAKKKQ